MDGTGHRPGTSVRRAAGSTTIREQRHHLHHAIDDRPVPIRLLSTVVALASLPILGTGVRALGIGVRALGSAVDLGRPVVPLLALAHGPTVVALLAVWSVGCIRYRSETGVTRTDSAGRS